MMRWLAWFVVATFCLAGPLPGTPGSAVEPLYIPRGPIIIDDYLDLSIGGMPNLANGVRSGDGSASNPFVISGWLFKFGEGPNLVPPVTAISIRNIGSAHILIDDNRFESVAVALDMKGTSNVAFTNNVVLYSLRGVDVLEPARDVTIEGNVFTAATGVEILGTSSSVRDIQILDNTFISPANGDGIWLGGGSNILIERNTITGFDQGRGIYCGGCNAAIKHNAITDSSVGIEIRFGGGTIMDNRITENADGIIQDWAAFRIEDNNFENNAGYALEQRYDPSPPDPYFENNYWGHADGPDGDHWDTPGQDVTGVELDWVFPWLTSANPDAGP